MSAAVVAEVIRNGFVEGYHFGSVVITAPDGSVESLVGVVDRPILPRSANKPAQALGMLRCGLELPDELLALAAASHSGEPMHLDGVYRILETAGLNQSDLGTPPAYPLDELAREEWIRTGRGPEPIAMNCSGKHAAMLATCVANGWPTVTYRHPEHPVQLAIRAALEDISGERVASVAVDGCGAPLLAISLTGLARAFGRLASAAAQTPAGRVAEAVRTRPEYVSGTRRDEAALMRATPGLLCKGGAEGVYAAGLPDGRGIAVKISDGAARARSVVLAETLYRLGLDNPTIQLQREHPVLGGGDQVGVVRAVCR
ncbi:MAG: asparaginase [Pseudonocardia sp.]|nr:asparaginase [Pseudonocardia sp.]